MMHLHQPDNTSRREFHRRALQSLTALALIEGLAARRLFARDVEPIIKEWFGRLDTISKDVKDHTIKDVEFQTALENLYRRVDLDSLLTALDFDKLAADITFPKLGAASITLDFQKVLGIPQTQLFGGQIFALKQGRSVVPHGHDNMATGFLILKGKLRGRHYDRVEDLPKHYLIKPTIDRSFDVGEFSTISDHKDNIHWFQAESETAFIFNVHVFDTDAENPHKPGRVYVDPEGEKLEGGLIKAPKATYGHVTRKYG